jgi:tripartite-type tricarboxylate transporter receptor subunit TctC
MLIRPKRRDVLRLGTAAALLPAPALAQAWPARPIKIVCTYPPGGLTDVFSRAYGEYVSQKVGQPVVVENKAGAAGAIGAELVKQSPPDGYTLMFTNSTTMMQNKVLFKKLPYDPDKDFTLVAWFNTGHLPTAVNKDVPVKNIPEFAAWAKERKVSAAT